MATILVVDDDREIRELIRIALRADGHAVAEAKDARQGIELALLLVPDAIITDYRLGKQETGIDLVRAVRQTDAHCPIIFWTGESRVRDLAEAAGVNYFFEKSRDGLAQIRAAVDEVTRMPVIIPKVKLA